MLRLQPQTGAARGTLVFLRGGGFAQPISAGHWQFAARVVRTAGLQVMVPLYALASALSGDFADRLRQVLLLSPWVDLTMSNAAIAALAPTTSSSICTRRMPTTLRGLLGSVVPEGRRARHRIVQLLQGGQGTAPARPSVADGPSRAGAPQNTDDCVMRQELRDDR